MKLSLFDYNLPKEMIATEPAKPRDAAKLFIYNRLDKKCVHSTFYDIGKFLQKGDVLVLNNTKVIPARLTGRLIHDDGMWGRKFKILLLERKISPRPSFSKREESWSCLIDGKGREVGIRMFFSKNLQGEIIKKIGGGIWEMKFNKSGKILDVLVDKIGQMPLPPYIKQPFDSAQGLRKNRNWYQTVYAKYAGSVAAPTAGLHFTSRLLKQLEKQGIKIEYVTLHVGMGTFLPVKTENITEHKIHEELAIISPKTAKTLNAAKKEGRRIIACGTTTARTLESFAVPVIPDARRAYSGIQENNNWIPDQVRDDRRENGYLIKSGKKRTKIFIYPPYKPKFVDALITNFHLPKSTLMMLVAVFLSPGDKKGIKKIQELYAEAIKKKYRFYSYGDAMLVI